MRTKSVVNVLGVAALFVALVAVPAQADTQARLDAVRGGPPSGESARPAFATFEGRTIDLAGDWGEARACLVWRQGGVVECFRSSQALDAREAQLAPRRPTAPGSSEPGSSLDAAYSYSCSSGLRLYEHNFYSGRRLTFWDRGYWQNLGDYSFSNRTSSYIVGGCWVGLADYRDGGGAWYPGPTYPYAGEPFVLWDWDDAISSIYIF